MADAVPGQKPKPALLPVMVAAILCACAIALGAVLFLLPALQPSAPVTTAPLKPAPFKPDIHAPPADNPAAALDPAASAQAGLSDAIVQDRVMNIMQAIQRKTKELKPNSTCDPKLIEDEMADFDRALAQAANPWGAVAMRARQVRVMVLMRCDRLADASEELERMLAHAPDKQQEQIRFRLALLLAQQHEAQRLDELLAAAQRGPTSPEGVVNLQLLDTVAWTQIGHPFYNFALPDLQGSHHALGDYRGRLLLLHLWMTPSPESQAEIPKLAALYAKHHGDGLDFLGVDCDDHAQPGDKAVAQMPWPQVNARLVWPGARIGPFGVRRLPSAFLIGPDGLLIAEMDSVGDQAEIIERAVSSLRAGAAPAH